MTTQGLSPEASSAGLPVIGDRLSAATAVSFQRDSSPRAALEWHCCFADAAPGIGVPPALAPASREI
jgi:hypothetical protein